MQNNKSMNAGFLATQTRVLFEDQSTKTRDFTCRVNSIDAEIYFLKLEDLCNAIRPLATEVIKEIYLKRRDIFSKQLVNA
jgi:hypothetical protein